MHHQRQTSFLVVAALFAAACSPLLPTPDEFPEPPVTPIVEFPTGPAATPTRKPASKPILGNDMASARTFFLVMKVRMAAGDSTSIAESVSYPIQVRVHGQATTMLSPVEFEDNYEAIFSQQLQQAIAAADENDLELQLDGIQAVDGVLWFKQFCADPACTQGEFLITQINN